MNLMGCRIYRHTKLQLGKYTTPDTFSSIGFRHQGAGSDTGADTTTNALYLSKRDIQPSIIEKQEDEDEGITTAR